MRTSRDRSPGRAAPDRSPAVTATRGELPVLQLQRSIGNSAVCRLLARQEVVDAGELDDTPLNAIDPDVEEFMSAVAELRRLGDKLDAAFKRGDAVGASSHREELGWLIAWLDNAAGHFAPDDRRYQVWQEERHYLIEAQERLISAGSLTYNRISYQNQYRTTYATYFGRWRPDPDPDDIAAQRWETAKWEHRRLLDELTMFDGRDPAKAAQFIADIREARWQMMQATWLLPPGDERTRAYEEAEPGLDEVERYLRLAINPLEAAWDAMTTVRGSVVFLTRAQQEVSASSGDID